MDIKWIIEQAKKNNSDFSSFIAWLETVDHLSYEVEDWGNMCGVMVEDSISNAICFNFYDDGSFRAIIDASENCFKNKVRIEVDKEIHRMSFWELLKRKIR